MAKKKKKAGLFSWEGVLNGMGDIKRNLKRSYGVKPIRKRRLY